MAEGWEGGWAEEMKARARSLLCFNSCLKNDFLEAAGASNNLETGVMQPVMRPGNWDSDRTFQDIFPSLNSYVLE